MSEDRLRAVTTAIAERDHLKHVRGLLAQDVTAEEQRVQRLAKELQYERADVEKLTTGVMGFLHTILDQNALAREQREVVEAQARLREAQGSLDLLRAQLLDVEARFARLAQANLEAELAAARRAREQVLLRSGTATAAQLRDLAIRIESIDIELVPLVDAVQAGTAATAGIAEILAMFDAAAVARSELERATRQAKALAGAAQASIVRFQRALSDLATASFTEPPAVDPADTTFADAWVRGLFEKRAPEERVASARASMVARSARIAAVLAPIRARHDELAARRAALVAERDQLVG